ncbi:MAG: nucleotidyltransferase domain-containing protein [Clostridia bacterium]|nr:nucleotidyltransferase domain-containing protein [Clostridia bacterium]
MGKIQTLPKTQEKAIQESTMILKKLLKKNLIKVVLYGSYARGDYNKFSDIDIFILVNNKKDEINKILNLICESLFELDLKYNVTINPLVENLQVFNEYKDCSLLFENIEKDGVVLYG